MKEEEFLTQFWVKVNPLNEDFIDSNIVLEFLKLIYDPYSGPSLTDWNAKNKEQLIQEFL